MYVYCGAWAASVCSVTMYGIAMGFRHDMACGPPQAYLVLCWYLLLRHQPAWHGKLFIVYTICVVYRGGGWVKNLTVWLHCMKLLLWWWQYVICTVYACMMMSICVYRDVWGMVGLHFCICISNGANVLHCVGQKFQTRPLLGWTLCWTRERINGDFFAESCHWLALTC